MKYILIWEYHDTYVYTYDSLKELYENLDLLKAQYKYDSDFKYEIYEGNKINEVIDYINKKEG